MWNEHAIYEGVEIGIEYIKYQENISAIKL